MAGILPALDRLEACPTMLSVIRFRFSPSIISALSTFSAVNTYDQVVGIGTDQ
jgi:hypothetical protein